jgi:hypothetical protein
MSCKEQVKRTRANIEYEREMRRIRIQQAKECSDAIKRMREACQLPKRS